MRPTYHRGTVFCAVCGSSLPGPAYHHADRVNGSYQFYCARCKNLVMGMRKPKQFDRERIEQGKTAAKQGSPV